MATLGGMSNSPPSLFRPSDLPEWQRDLERAERAERARDEARQALRDMGTLRDSLERARDEARRERDEKDALLRSLRDQLEAMAIRVREAERVYDPLPAALADRDRQSAELRVQLAAAERARDEVLNDLAEAMAGFSVERAEMAEHDRDEARRERDEKDALLRSLRDQLKAMTLRAREAERAQASLWDRLVRTESELKAAEEKREYTALERDEARSRLTISERLRQSAMADLVEHDRNTATALAALGKGHESVTSLNGENDRLCRDRQLLSDERDDLRREVNRLAEICRLRALSEMELQKKLRDQTMSDLDLQERRRDDRAILDRLSALPFSTHEDTRRVLKIRLWEPLAALGTISAAIENCPLGANDNTVAGAIALALTVWDGGKS